MARFNYIPNRVIDTNGISDGASIFFYLSGTTTKISIYSDNGLATPIANPHVVPAGAEVIPIYFAQDTDDVRVRVVSDGGEVISDDDPYDPPLNASDLGTLLDGKVDLDGVKNVRAVMGSSNPLAYVFRVDSVADAKQVDGFFGSAVMQNGGSGYPFHGIMTADASIGPDAAGGGGFAADGPGNASGVVGNRQGAGPGNGVQGARVGSGIGAGVEARASSTGECYAVRGIKQNPVAGTAGTGPAVWAINDSTNGQALYARSASANTDANTAVIERLNGTAGTGLFTRVTGAGPRTGVLVGGSTQITPSSSSTGASAVIGQDIQVSGNISGSASVKTLNVNNSSTAGSESAGAAIVVDGANTTNYGVFVNVANGTTNYGIYVANGISYFGGNANAATQYQVGAVKVVGARKTGWATATGTATRTTFDTTTVTTAQLAERVKALIDDLYSTAGHGLLGA